MNKLAMLLTLLLLLAGLAYSFYWSNPADTGVVTEPSFSVSGRSGHESVNHADLTQRIALLEQQLAYESAQRENLQLMLEQLLDEPGDVQFERPVAPARGQSPEQNAETREEFRERMQTRNSDVRRIQRLESSGFDTQQAAWILEREQQIQLQELGDRWEQRRQSYLDNPDEFASDNPLRAELGEQAYERYLEANNRPTSVAIRNVIEGSPASLAGFQSGDEIVAYNGERVFNMNELNTTTVQGNRGQPVMVDVIRNGNRIQLTVERGPLGISTRGRRGGWAY